MQVHQLGGRHHVVVQIGHELMKSLISMVKKPPPDDTIWRARSTFSVPIIFGIMRVPGPPYSRLSFEMVWQHASVEILALGECR
jgi:hypothetical protein